jgi:hypothetical protein
MKGIVRAALLALALAACGGAVDAGEADAAPEAVDAGPCDKAAALDAYRAAHGQTGQVGQWTVAADCVVTEAP